MRKSLGLFYITLCRLKSAFFTSSSIVKYWRGTSVAYQEVMVLCLEGESNKERWTASDKHKFWAFPRILPFYTSLWFCWFCMKNKGFFDWHLQPRSSFPVHHNTKFSTFAKLEWSNVSQKQGWFFFSPWIPTRHSITFSVGPHFTRSSLHNIPMRPQNCYYWKVVRRMMHFFRMEGCIFCSVE